MSLGFRSFLEQARNRITGGFFGRDRYKDGIWRHSISPDWPGVRGFLRVGRRDETERDHQKGGEPDPIDGSG
ncbi:MAG: hypothetical protein WD737_13150 [Gemmatimonadota bacterium]